MNIEKTLAIALIFTAASYALLGLRLASTRREAGVVPVGVLFVVIAFWVLGGAIELLATSFDVFSIGRTGHFFGTSLVPIVAYVCFREYVGKPTSGRRLAVLSVMPAIAISLAATNQYHGLMWHEPFVTASGDFLTRPAEWGPWFLFAHLPFSYLVIGAAILTLLVHSTAVPRDKRRSLFLLTAACLGPLVATALYDLGYGPNTISYVPLVFTAMLPVYYWLIMIAQVFGFSPLAYEIVFQNMQDPVVVIDDKKRIIGLNSGAERMLSIEEGRALHSPLSMLFGNSAPEVFEALDTGKPQKMMTESGRFLHVQVSEIDGDRDMGRGGKVLMFRDVSDVQKAQTEVRQNEKLLRTLIDHSVNGIVRFRWVESDNGERQLHSIFANAAAGRFLSADATSLVACPAVDVIRRAVTGMDDADVEAIVEQFEAAVNTGQSLDIEVRQDNGGVARWLRLICECIGEDYAATFVDVTDRKVKEREMDSIASSDPLTGVLNRRGFERDASRRLSQSDDDATGALLFIDLNGFKQINDDFGHEVGDQLLKIAAARLKRSLRSCDIIGRPGGDEFVALVPDVNAESADHLARRLSHALEKNYEIDGQKMLCTASIGLALYPENSRTLTGLLREADQAMYRAKARCRGVPNISGGDFLEKAG
ncbi:MAG: diguanylate cyclase [Gammaproteobacteria bacterium]|nr:diguanylate cyclase [Gammaproteobacteria bacterium]NNF48840.1 diguanylate cyclase [Woeseiaceae bacterium]MBT8093798.1 diguanylate cyclase [Gammaproteobacteria bacterium]MBT8105882.1 diguanylate cyclase [Gammaproteobacteria bacterium]NNK25896.1 diguanylate cyclase [Woeseiaceae bacterium]